MKSHRIAVLLVALLRASPLIAQETSERSPLTQLSGSIRELTHRVAPAVVEIVVTGYATPADDGSRVMNQVSLEKSSGSGVIVDSAGYIVTNAHVIQGALRVHVLIPTARVPAETRDTASPSGARTVDAHIIGVDTKSDLALIRVDESELPSLGFGDSDGLRQGDLVFAIGSPIGLRNSVSMGVVSGTARPVSDDNPILYIQTDASINPGNSGGALVDSRGVLVGLSTFIVSRSGGSEGIGFAIPSNVVRNVYDQLKHTGKVSRGTVGLFVQDINPVMAKGLDLPLEQGVVVADVEPDGPCDRAGIKRRDVIVSLNSHTVESARQFEDAIYRHHGGETISMGIRRGGDRLTAPVQAREQSAQWDPLAALASPEKNLVPRLGILCIEIDKTLAGLMPELRRSYGIIVAARAPQGQAQFVDLQAGDIIHAVNNTPIAALPHFQEVINGFKQGDAVVLQIERDSKFQYIAFEIE